MKFHSRLAVFLPFLTKKYLHKILSHTEQLSIFSSSRFLVKTQLFFPPGYLYPLARPVIGQKLTKITRPLRPVLPNTNHPANDLPTRRVIRVITRDCIIVKTKNTAKPLVNTHCWAVQLPTP